MLERRPVRVLIWEHVSGGGMVDRELPESWAAEGSAIRRAIVADFAADPAVQVLETIDARCPDRDPAPANVTRIVVDRDRPVDLGELCRRADLVVIVAPEADGVLCDLDRWVAWSGGRSLGSSPGALALCSTKLRLAEYFDRIGVPTPLTLVFSPSNGLPAIPSESGRVVVKPTDGAGAVDTFVLEAGSSCPASLLDRSIALVQPFRPGPAFSASFLVGRDGRAHLIAVGLQKIEVGPMGEVRFEGGEVPVDCSDLDLAPVRKAVGSIPGLLGFVGVDFVRVEPTGVIEVIEINPRLTTSIVGLVHLAPTGTIARAWLDCLGDDPEIGPAEPDPDLSRRNRARIKHREPSSTPSFEPDADFLAIRSAPSIRFRADGSIIPEPEVTR